MRIFVLYQIKKQMEKITLATLEQATAQQVFDQVAVHLLTQGKKSERYCPQQKTDKCVYKSNEGYSCAAGCLISEDEYIDRMEGKVWAALIDRKIVKTNAHEQLICSLQDIHDDFTPEEWRYELFELASELGLNTSAIANV